MNDKLLAGTGDLAGFAETLTASRRAGPAHISLEPDSVKNGLARLALTLIELLRELLERQAIRRMEAGSVSADEVERLGTTFMQLAAQMDQLRQQFGLEPEDLNIDLGPLGQLI